MDEKRLRQIVEEELHLRGINGGSFKELRADFYWVRNRRLGEQTIKTWVIRAIVTTLVAGGLYALFSGIGVHLG